MAIVNGTKKTDVITVENASSVIVVTNKKSTPNKINKKGKNYIYGAGGGDTINVKAGNNNYIYGDDKKKKLTGKDKITISGGSKNTIYGGKGNDTITIKGGKKNIIYGGKGNDSFIYVKNKKNATVTIKDYKYGENGTGDTFTVQKAAVSGLTKSGKNLKFAVGKGSVTLTKAVDASVYVKDKRGGYFVYVDSLSGSGSVWLDKFTGTFDAGKFKPITDISLNSSEIKKGLTLKGNSNDNSIYAGNYNDKLYGKGGDNTLFGGSGNDTFVFDKTSKGTTIINDYTTGDDIIAFSDGIGYDSNNVTFSDNDVILNLTTGGTINIQGAKGKVIAFDLKNNGKITSNTFS